MTFAKIFIPANKNCESFNRFKVSKEKVEKVVNPPQNPIPKNIFKLWLNICRSSNP